MLYFLLVLLQIPSGSCKELFETAVAAIRQNNADQATSVLNHVPAECARLESFFELRGVANDLSGKSAAAESDFEKAVSLQPDVPRLLGELGTVYLRNKKVDRAVDVLSRAFRLDPTNLAIGRYLIAAYVQLKQWQDAARIFDDLGAGTKPGVLDPPVMIVWFAQSLVETKRLNEVEIRLSPTQAGMTPPILFALGEVFAQHRLYAQVVTFLSRIADQDADDAVSFNLGVAYSHLQRYEEARRCYFEAIDKHPGHSGAYLGVGLDFASGGDPRRAIPWMARAHELAPDRVEITYALSAQLLRLEYVTSAEELLGGALQSHPGEPLLLVGAGDVKAAQHRSAAAAELYRKALVQKPDFAPALVGLARSNIAQEKTSEARAELKQALSKEPDDPAVNGTLGLVESHQANWAGALPYLQRSWDKDRSNPEVLLALARAYNRAGRSAEALQLLLTERTRMASYPAFHLELSQVYSQLHRTDEAKREQDAVRTLQSNEEGLLRFEKPQSYVF